MIQLMYVNAGWNITPQVIVLLHNSIDIVYSLPHNNSHSDIFLKAFYKQNCFKVNVSFRVSFLI